MQPPPSSQPRHAIFSPCRSPGAPLTWTQPGQAQKTFPEREAPEQPGSPTHSEYLLAALLQKGASSHPSGAKAASDGRQDSRTHWQLPPPAQHSCPESREMLHSCLLLTSPS